MNDDRTFISTYCPFKFCNSYIHKKKSGKISQMDVNERCTSALFFDSVSFNPCIAFTFRVKSNAPVPHLKMSEMKRKMTTKAVSWLRQGAKRISPARQLSIHGSPTSALWEGNSPVFRRDNKTEWWEDSEKTGLFQNTEISAGYEYGLGVCVSPTELSHDYIHHYYKSKHITENMLIERECNQHRWIRLVLRRQTT